MNFVKDWKIGTKLAGGFGVLACISLLMAVVGLIKMKTIDSDVLHLTQVQMARVAKLSQIKDNANVSARSIRNIVLLSDTKAQQNEKTRIEEAVAKNKALLSQISDDALSAKGTALLADLNQARPPYLAALNKAVELATADDAANTTTYLMGDMRKAQSAYFKAIDALVESETKEMQDSGEAVHASVTATSSLMAAMALGALIFSALTAIVIIRSITQPIQKAVKVAQAVAAGDLTSRIEITSHDETGELLDALNTMNTSLASLVGQVKQSSDSIATGSSQIAMGSADLSQRTEEQASNLQQTAASMEQLTSAVANSSDTARQARDLAVAGIESARRGGASVTQVVSTMQEIAASSQKVSDIIGVIDGIAFQTNILALNAAVEAARAGEQGRGFAVVAGEVRALAQRSANAAKEIKTLIGSSTDRVDAGAQQVQEAGRAMEDIVSQVQRVGDLIAELSSAASEQSSGISQIGNAITQLDDVTQRNAALVEESTAAAESLREQASRLANAIQRFRL